VNELVIKGGIVIDGTGAPGVRADVAVRDGRISAIGQDLDGDRVLDAGEHVVTPGFIDLHTHYDAQVFWDPRLTPSCFHGVTTVVAGNCGFTIAPTRPEHRDLIARTLQKVEDMDVEALRAGIPWDFTTFPEYLSSIERRGTGLNFMAYIGHTALRIFAMGEEASQREAKPEELAQMREMVREAMEAGAAGFATSFAITHQGADGRPIPSRVSNREEVVALLEALKEAGRGLAAFAMGDVIPVDQLYELQPYIGRPFTLTALLSSPRGFHLQLLETNAKGWTKGAQVWPQVSPRPLRFSCSMTEPFTLNVNSNFAALMPESLETRRAAYADPAFRARCVSEWSGGRSFMPRWETFVVSESVNHPDLVGRKLTDVAADKDGTPFDVLMDLASEEPDMRVDCMLANDDPEAVAHILAQDHCVLGLSDAGAHVGQLCDAAQATDYLGNWIREKKILPLEEGVRRLTSQQADVLGLPDRGRLEPGNWADIVVFDPDTVSPGPTRRVRDFPAGTERLTADQPTGIRHVLVNGTPIQVDGVHDPDARPGRVLHPA
jgi:N-acyl-D-aspartate/D-glutamate deacylase